ncbi:ribonuclease H1 [Trypanosoma conorhini]|uniref:ribonuclease H n=1 Tax=Trypanosoma conorhini TaxID=83891 RepID=A0A422PVX3_9TRYP|nr:ribonuclease H1 [Trypanosoma conorhini]RNF21901.1 ribonuclease H1 [Trypanosoma conorhini]
MPSSSSSSKKKKKYYAVAAGHKTGVCESWDECSRYVTGFPRARFKSFKTLEEAQAFLAAEDAASNRGAAKGAEDVACDAAPALGGKRRRHSPASSASSSSSALSLVEDIAGERGMLQRVSRDWVRARELEAVEVYVDGACRANGKGRLACGGYGGFYGENDPRNFSLPLPAAEPQTNNRAELHAVIHVLRTAVEAESCYNLRVFSDSAYTIRGADFYMQKWLRNGFWGSSGSSVANCDLWQTLNSVRSKHAGLYSDLLVAEFGLLPALARRLARRLALQLVHVKGHAGVRGNEMADRLAVMGALHKRSAEDK